MSGEVEQRIVDLVSILDLGRPNREPEPVRGGFLHRIFHVTTDTGDYAVKLLNPAIMRRPDAYQNMINAERIAEAFAGVLPAVAALRIRGRQIHSLKGVYCIVYPWIDGEPLFPPMITPAHCRAIGEILGKMHAARLSLHDIAPEEGEALSFDWQAPFSDGALQNEDPPWLKRYREALPDLMEWDRQAREADAYLRSERVVSHRDLDPKNVLWPDKEPRVIDWEAAGWINPHQELLEILNYWTVKDRGEVDDACADALISAYRDFVDPDDTQWAQAAAGSRAAMLGWLQYNVRRAMGRELTEQEDAQTGAAQVVSTIDELYGYRNRLGIFLYKLS